jgi:hypothetical protein
LVGANMLANARLATVARKAIRFTALLLVLLELSARTDDNPYQSTKSSLFPRGHKTIQTLPVPFFSDLRRCRMRFANPVIRASALFTPAPNLSSWKRKISEENSRKPFPEPPRKLYLADEPRHTTANPGRCAVARPARSAVQIALARSQAFPEDSSARAHVPNENEFPGCPAAIPGRATVPGVNRGPPGFSVACDSGGNFAAHCGQIRDSFSWRQAPRRARDGAA